MTKEEIENLFVEKIDAWLQTGNKLKTNGFFHTENEKVACACPIAIVNCSNGVDHWDTDKFLLGNDWAWSFIRAFDDYEEYLGEDGPVNEEAVELGRKLRQKYMCKLPSFKDL